MAGAGPIEGVRVPVKLPWKSVAHNEEQFVSVKKPVAEYLKLKPAEKKDLIYKGQIRYKEKDADGKPTGALLTKTVDRTRRPGFRERSIKVIFGDRKTGKRKTVSIGGGKRGSFNFPITRGIAINSIWEEFMFGDWKSYPVVRIVDTSTGQGYPIY